MKKKNKLSKHGFETYTKKSIFCKLDKFDHFAKKDDFIELTSWFNGEGFDINIHAAQHSSIQLTWGQWEAIKKMIKCVDV